MTTQGLTPEESLLAAAIRLAIRDATKHRSEHVRAEAWRWLWWIAPAVAERVWDQHDEQLTINSR